MKLDRPKIIALALLLFFLYFPFFSNLDHLTVRIWDEARQAVLAYEMMHSDNIFVTTFHHAPDHWNLKPPLLIWCQSILMHVFGPYEFALRLPSAVAGLLTALTLLLFFWKYYDRFWLGIIAALVLSTVLGYVDDHGVRSGDYDSMVTFFAVLYSLLFFLYFERGKNKYLYAAFTALTLAAMTKGIAGVLFLPAIALYGIFSGKVKTVLTNKHFYFSMLIFLVIVPGFYLLREHYDPGYIDLVKENEWGGRYSKPIEGHVGSFWFYFELIRFTQMNYWILLLPCGVAAGLLDPDKNFRKFTIFVCSVILVYWTITSISETKIEWYSYPIIPLLSAVVGMFLFYIFRILQQIEIPGILKKPVLPFAFLFLVFFKPYNFMFNRVYMIKEPRKEDYNLTYYLRDIAKGKATLVEPLHIVFRDYNFHFHIYQDIINDKQPANQVIFNPCDELNAGDLVLCSQNDVNECINQKYVLTELHKEEFFYLYRVNGRKS